MNRLRLAYLLAMLIGAAFITACKVARLEHWGDTSPLRRPTRRNLQQNWMWQ